MANENPEGRTAVRLAHRSPVSLEVNEIGIMNDAHMFDYSSSGLYFESDFYLVPGSDLFIGVKNSPFRSPPGTYECYRAVIRWRKHLENSSFDYGYGVELKGKARSREKAPPSPELRRHPRKACSVPTLLQGRAGKARGVIQNAGYGGVFVRCDQAFTPGQHLSLTIPYRKQQKLITRLGEVVWAERNGIGIKFEPESSASSDHPDSTRS